MSRFSSSTIMELLDAFQFTTHAQIGDFVTRFELEEADNQGMLNPRRRGIVTYLIDHPDKRGPFGANVIVEIIEYLLEIQCRFSDPEEKFPRLVRALKRDGYVVQDGKLKTTLPADVQLAATED